MYTMKIVFTTDAKHSEASDNLQFLNNAQGLISRDLLFHSSIQEKPHHADRYGSL